jgi:hypothetical protein
MALSDRPDYQLAIALVAAGHSIRLHYRRERPAFPRRALSLDGLRALVEHHPAVLSVGGRALPGDPPLPEPADHTPRGTNPL